jgi:hypothetical protein
LEPDWPGAAVEDSALPRTRLRWMVKSFLAPHEPARAGLPPIRREDIVATAAQLLREGVKWVELRFTVDLLDIVGHPDPPPPAPRPPSKPPPSDPFEGL